MSAAQDLPRQHLPTVALPGLLRRLTAGLIDLVVFGSLSALLVVTGVIDLSRFRPTGALLPTDHLALSFSQSPQWTASQWLLLWLGPCLGAILFAMFGRPTPGQWLMRLWLMGPDGGQASMLRGVLRGLAILTLPATLMLGGLLTLILPSQQGLHDLISGVRVVSR